MYPEDSIQNIVIFRWQQVFWVTASIFLKLFKYKNPRWGPSYGPQNVRWFVLHAPLNNVLKIVEIYI